MHHIHKIGKPAAATLLLLLAVLALAACGGSSSASTGASSSTGSSTNSKASAPAGAGGRFAAVRECLQKNGITLPRRTPGQGPPQGGLPGGGGKPPLPSGVSQAQYEAAMKKCGGGAFRGGGAGANSAAFKLALPKFAACMRENGVNLPTPNTSGNGPVFDTKGLNTGSAQFKSAQTKCQPILTAARGQRGQGPGAPGGPAS